MEPSDYDEFHDQLRESLSKYLDTKVVGIHSRWSERGDYDEDELRQIFKEMGGYGWIMPWAEEAYGGCEADLLTSCIICQTLGKKGLTGITTWLHSETAGPYLQAYANEDQKKKYLTGAIAGTRILGVAMTEPDSGSDLAAIKTTAKKTENGYLLNGSKCFITNGSIADTLIVACKTGDGDGRHPALSLFIVDGDSEGLTRRRIKKVGGNEMDNAELFFENVFVPESNLLGQEGGAYRMLLEHLLHERLMAAANYEGLAERALDLTIEYVKQRVVYGKRVADFQNTSFTLADLYSKVIACKALVHELAVKVNDCSDTRKYIAQVSAAKSYSASIAQECMRKGAQLHGGYGACNEYEIGRLFADSGILSIAAGTTEIMKLLIGREIIGK